MPDRATEDIGTITPAPRLAQKGKALRKGRREKWGRLFTRECLGEAGFEVYCRWEISDFILNKPLEVAPVS